MVAKITIRDRDGKVLDLILLLGWQEEYEVPWFDDNMMDGQSDPNKIHILQRYIAYLDSFESSESFKSFKSSESFKSFKSFKSLGLYRNSWSRVLSHMKDQVCYITCI